VKKLVLVTAMLAAACGQPAEPQAGRLTVLIPPELARAESLQGDGVLIDQTHYSVTQSEDQMTLSLTGSLVDREESGPDLPPATPTGTLRGVPVFITENEGIKTATWIEKGTAFALDIECDAATDSRCVSSEYLMTLVGRLVERPVSR